MKYYPGETNLYRADVVVINKIDSAEPERSNRCWPTSDPQSDATIVKAKSPVTVRATHG